MEELKEIGFRRDNGYESKAEGGLKFAFYKTLTPIGYRYALWAFTKTKAVDHVDYLEKPSNSRIEQDIKSILESYKK